MKRLKSIKINRLYILAFFIPALILYISYAIFGVAPFGDKSALVLDLNGQYIYFYEGLKNALFGDGSLFYSWSRNLSGEFFGIFGYYLSSPFSLIPVLLPRAALVDAIMLMQLAKVGACGVTFAYFINKSKRLEGLPSAVFSTLYALCAYNVVQIMNPMWIDGVIYFPLIILGVERIVNEKKVLGYIIPLALMFLANFYIGYMVGIFSAIYFLIYLAVNSDFSSLKNLFSRSFLYAIGSILAILIGMVIIFPVYKALSLGKMEFAPPDNYAVDERFAVLTFLGKLFPLSYDSVNVQGLPFVYCGLLTLLVMPLFFAAKKISLRKKICGFGLAAVSFILMYITITDLFMHGGQWPNWLNYRYSFIFSFLILSMASEAFAHLGDIERKNLFASYAVIIGLIIILKDYWGALFEDVKVFWAFIAFFTVYLLFVYLSKRKSLKTICSICLLIVISGELIYNSVDSFKKIDEEVLYSTKASYNDWYNEFKSVVDEVENRDSSFYRMETTYHRTVNDPMALGIAGISHSSSLMNSKTMDFIQQMGYTSRGFASKYNGGTIVGDSLLGFKYFIVDWEDTGAGIVPKNKLHVFDDLYKDIYNNGYVLHVYENPYALPIAFYADKALESTVFTDNVFENQNLLLNNILGTSGVEYFKKAEIQRTLNNLEELDAIDQMRYAPIEYNASSSIDYAVKSEISGQLYMYLPTNYHRKSTVNFNGTSISDYFADDEHVALALGNVEAGTENYASVILGESDLFMIDAYFYVLDEAAFSSAVEQIKANSSVVEKKNDAKLKMTVSCAGDGYIYTSIPYQKGWTVKVDGKRTEPVCIGNSLLAIPVTKGEHKVTMKFVPDGFKVGLLLSLVGIAAVLFAFVYPKYRARFKKSAEKHDKTAKK